ncbi:MAG: hypothetical protein GY866_21745, partial [Proteobacteria bacterium]|nr:hypothetical protein [Pseudomonadota bacterium]
MKSNASPCSDQPSHDGPRPDWGKRMEMNNQPAQRKNMVLDPWKTLKSRYIVDDEWLTLRADRCETAEGVIIDPFYVLE